MSTITHRASIGKSRFRISACGQRPPRLMLIRTVQRTSLTWVSKSTSSTSYAECQGTTGGNSSWSSCWTKTRLWRPRLIRLSPSSSKWKLPSRERMGSLQKHCPLQRRVAKAAEVAKSAKVQSGIREIIWTIGKKRISGSAFIASGKVIPSRTAWASNTAILQKLPTLQQKHRLRLLQSRTIGWGPAQVLHPGMGSLIADARLTSPAIDQCLSPTPLILQIRRRWRDTMGSHCFHPDMEVLGWFASWQMETLKQSYSKKWCNCQGRSTSFHNLKSWLRTS